MREESDVQAGRVVVNWQVTCIVIVALLVAFGYFIGADLAVSFVMGVLAMVVWLAWELYDWNPGASIPEPPLEESEEND
jgi:hypothetical protein